MSMFERISGARMHTALYKPLNYNVSWFNNNFIKRLLNLLLHSSRSINLSFLYLLNNKALKSRTSGVGQVSKFKLLNYGISGILIRSSGYLIDRRLSSNDHNYNYFNLKFNTFLGKKGDNYDRFVIRIKEVLQSYSLINQLTSIFLKTKINNSSTYKLDLKLFNSFQDLKFNYLQQGYNFSFKTNAGQLNANLNSLYLYNKTYKFTKMEDLIKHFKQYTDSNAASKSFSVSEVESPKGVLGFYL